MNSYPRVAFLPDTFHEINGVAHTSRQLEAFVRRRNIPFLSVHCGPVNKLTTEGAVRVMQLKRGPASFSLDAHLDCDPLLTRYGSRVMAEVKAFNADLIHVTGPGDMGVLGTYIAWKLNLPMVISWHTSLHEYAGRRLERLLAPLGNRCSKAAGQLTEDVSAHILTWFYRKAEIILAPNNDVIEELRILTKRPVFLMKRGVDTELFTPERRKRADTVFRIGYVGRLTPEKNVRFLAELGSALRLRGHTDFDFLIVGQGSEDEWLRERIPNATLTGVLTGERLAEAYADMDLFVFPSKTDTFGNVVLEALSSGVPAVVTSDGGPKFLVLHGVTGFVAASENEFVDAVSTVMKDAAICARMKQAARDYACAQSWDAVFQTVFEAYSTALQSTRDTHSQRKPLLSSRVHERGGS